MTAWINRPPSPAEVAKRERDEQRHRERLAESNQRIADLARPYPLYVCVQCYRVTGWLGNWKAQMLDGAGEDDSCFDCLRQGLYASDTDWEPIYEPLLDHGWLPARDERAKIEQSLRTLSGPRPPLWTRLAHALGYEGPYDRHSLKEWERGVSSWPERPPLGTPLRVRLGEKTEVNAPDGSGRLIVFRAGWYYWQDGRWKRHKHGSTFAAPRELPSVFSADLPIEQLLSAWDDFKAALALEDYDDWRQDELYRVRADEQEALAEQSEADRRDRDKRQRGVAGLF